MEGSAALMQKRREARKRADVSKRTTGCRSNGGSPEGRGRDERGCRGRSCRTGKKSECGGSKGWNNAGRSMVDGRWWRTPS